MNEHLFKKLHHYHKRTWQIILVAMGAVGGLAGIGMIAGHYFAPQLVRYEPEIISTLSDTLNRPVTVSHLSALWEGFGPVIHLQEVKIWDVEGKQTIVKIQDAEVRLSVFDLLKKRKIVTSAILLDNVEASLHQKPDGMIDIVGFESTSSDTNSDPYALLNDITDQGNIEVTHANLDLELASGEIVFLKNVDGAMGRRFGNGYFELSGELIDTAPRGNFNVSMTVDPTMLAKQQWQSDLTVSLSKAELLSWLRLWPILPATPVVLQSGKGDIEVGFTWKASELTRIETLLALQELAIEWTETAPVLDVTPALLTTNTQQKPPAAEIKPATPVKKTYEVISISGKGLAKHTRTGWNIVGSSFVKPVTGGTLSANGSVLLTPDSNDIEVDISAHADDIPAPETLKVVLDEVGDNLPEVLSRWLRESILSGTIAQADMVLKGPIRDFPFRSGDGHFEVNADMIDAELKFHPKWESISIEKGKINFRGDEFYSLIQKGKAGGGEIVEAAVVIPELKMVGSDLNVTGIVRGDAKDAVAYMKNTSVWDNLKKKLEPLVLEGPIQIDIDFDTPLGVPGGERLIGAITFEGDKVGMPQWKLDFTDLRGKMTFNLNGVYANNLTAKLYQQPVQVQFATQHPEKSPNYLKLAVQGEVQMLSINQHYPNAFWSDWKGGTTYTAEVELHDDTDPIPSRVHVVSNLQGLTVNLPAPFHKQATKAEPLIFDLQFSPSNKHLQFYYDAAVRADLYSEGKSKTSFTRGMIEINPADIKTPLKAPDQGIQIIGTLPTLDMDGWMSRMEKVVDGKSSNFLPSITGKLKVDNVLFMKEDLHIQTINLQRLSQEWKIGFSGKDAQGSVVLPHNLSQNPIGVSLDYLHWKTAEDKTVGNPPPDNFPNVNVAIKDLMLDDKKVGQVNFSTKMGKRAMTVNPLRVSHPDYKLVATAYWDWSKAPGTTSLKGKVTSQNLGGMLKEWNISSGLEGGKGTSTLDLRWSGGPAAWNVDNLQGEMILDWANGRLIDVKPGLGRILSLFSVDAKSIAQRLQLNFSDLTKKGFIFEKINADLIFDNGVINTKNGEVTSSSGKIIFSGNAYTVPKTLDVNLDVYPAISNSSNAIAAGVAIANPIAGAAVWAANKVLSPATDKLIKMRYHVTGPFDDPIITPVDSKGNAKNSSSKK